MSKFKTGAAAIAEAATSGSGGGKFTPEFFWKEGQERFIQFITPLDQIPKVPAYGVNVSTDGKTRMRSFIDNKGVEGVEYYNPLRDRFELEPQFKNMAVVVELEPVYDEVADRKKRVGFKVLERTFTPERGEHAGEEVSVPNVGVLIQTGKFFSYLTTWEEDKGPITETVFAIKRSDSKPVTYQWVPYEVNPVTKESEAVELDEEVLNAVDLDAYEEMLMSPARFHEWIDPLEDDAEPDRYAAQRKREREGKATEAKTKQKKVVAKEESDVEDSGDEDLDAKAKFAKLKEQFA